MLWGLPCLSWDPSNGLFFWVVTHDSLLVGTWRGKRPGPSSVGDTYYVFTYVRRSWQENNFNASYVLGIYSVLGVVWIPSGFSLVQLSMLLRLFLRPIHVFGYYTSENFIFFLIKFSLDCFVKYCVYIHAIYIPRWSWYMICFLITILARFLRRLCYIPRCYHVLCRIQMSLGAPTPRLILSTSYEYTRSILTTESAST